MLRSPDHILSVAAVACTAAVGTAVVDRVFADKPADTFVAGRPVGSAWVVACIVAGTSAADSPGCMTVAWAVAWSAAWVVAWVAAQAC